MGMIEYYQGDNKKPADTKREMKEKARRWLRMLNKEYDDGNRVGTGALYATLKMKSEDDHPSRSFVEDFVSRQLRHQTHKRVSKKSDVIQAVITKRPNQLMQVDYLYFYWAHDGIEDAQGEGPVPVDEKTDKPEDEEKEKEVTKLFNKNKIKYRGAIVAIDGFSRYAYTVPIEGNINSLKAKDAMIKILSMANREYPKYANKLRIIQTDKGSEFTYHFRDYLKTRNEGANKQYFKHIYGYTGRSQSQSLVERVNGTLKRLVTKSVGPQQSWVPVLEKITKVYNENYHSTIKTAPADVAKRDGESDDDYDTRLEKIEQLIYDRALKRGTADPTLKYKEGDYVRIRVFKPKPLDPKFTAKGGLADTKFGLARFEDEDLREEFDGVYMIHSVRKGHERVNDEAAAENNKPGRATTYRIVHNWPRESQPGSVPAGQTKARDRTKRISVRDSERFNGMQYERGAYGRNFTSTELSRVPQSNGLPIVDDREPIVRPADDRTDEEFVIQRIVSRERKPPKPKAGQKFRYMYWVKYKGFDKPEKVDYKSIAGTEAFDQFLEKNKYPLPKR